MKLTVTILLLVLLQVSSPAQETGWINLFNGKDLTGWKRQGGSAVFTVVNGEIVGRTVEKSRNTFLVTAKVLGNYVFYTFLCGNEFLSPLEQSVRITYGSGLFLFFQSTRK